MKNSLLILLLCLSSFHIWSQEIEEDIVLCDLENNPDLKAKITKTNDELYSLYVLNTSKANEWEKVMDLAEPTVWTKDGVGEIADFYSIASYSSWVRLGFTAKYKSLGGGEFVLPRPKDAGDGKKSTAGLTNTYGLENCTGTLK